MKFAGGVIIWAAAAVLAGVLSGCYSTPEYCVQPMLPPPVQAAENVLQQRQELFRQSLAHARLRSAVFHPCAARGHVTPEVLVDKVIKFGFNALACRITSETELDDYLRQVIRCAESRQLPVHIHLWQRDFYRKHQGYQLFRQLRKAYPDLRKTAAGVIEFAWADKENPLFISGITVVVEPHLINDSDAARSAGQLYSWSESTFGAGLDNDIMVRNALQELREIAALPGLPELTVGFPDFYHDLAAAGKLSCGKVADFAEISRNLMIVNSGNLPSQLVKCVASELAGAPGNSRVTVAIALADHVSIREANLRRRDWADLCRALKYADGKYRQYPVYQGVALAPLALIDMLYLEK